MPKWTSLSFEYALVLLDAPEDLSLLLNWKFITLPVLSNCYFHFLSCLHFYCSSDLDVCQTFKMWLLLFLRIIGYLHELFALSLCVTALLSEHNYDEGPQLKEFCYFLAFSFVLRNYRWRVCEIMKFSIVSCVFFLPWFELWSCQGIRQIGRDTLGFSKIQMILLFLESFRGLFRAFWSLFSFEELF